MRLQVVADQTGSKHTGDSRNRAKGGQPMSRSRRRTVEGAEVIRFWRIGGPGPAESNRMRAASRKEVSGLLAARGSTTQVTLECRIEL